jgi:hypothetical protein
MRFATVLGMVWVSAILTTAHASTPEMIGYQGILTDSEGEPLDTVVDIAFSIYDSITAGDLEWIEWHTGVQVSDGYFSVILGSHIPLDDQVFDDEKRYLAIKVGTDDEIEPRTQIVSSPYAMRVSTIDEASGGVITSGVNIQGGLTVQDKATIGENNTCGGTNAFVAGRDNGLSGNYSTISGGRNNLATDYCVTVGGGENNIAWGSHSTVGGGWENVAGDPGSFITISGGGGNSAYGHNSTVGGGKNNSADSSYATVSGGGSNVAHGWHAAISGGRANNAGGTYAAIGGGEENVASATSAVIGGGEGNAVSASHGTVGGGLDNTAGGSYSGVAAGRGNNSGGFGGAIGGGYYNTTGGLYSTVPGGRDNSSAGDYSLAAGRRDKADHNGTFVWADDTDADFTSTGVDQFLVRASGGVGIGTNQPTEQLEVAGNARIDGNLQFTGSLSGDIGDHIGGVKHWEWKNSIDGTGDIYDNGYVVITKINSSTTFRMICGHISGCTYVYYVNGVRSAGHLSNGGTVDINMGTEPSDARILFGRRMSGMDMLVVDVLNTNAPWMHFIGRDTK